MGYRAAPLSTKARLARDGLPYSGGGIRTRDLRVMSPTSYQTAPPRVATGDYRTRVGVSQGHGCGAGERGRLQHAWVQQLTRGFQSSNIPRGLCFQTQAWSS